MTCSLRLAFNLTLLLIFLRRRVLLIFCLLIQDLLLDLLGDLEQSIPGSFLLLALLLLFLTGVIGVPHLVALGLLLGFFLLLLLKLDRYLTLPQLFCVLWVIFLEEISLFDIFHLEMREGAYLFVLGHALIVGRVVKGLKTYVKRRSFLSTKHPCLSTDNIDDIKILVALLGEGDVNSRRQASIDTF